MEQGGAGKEATWRSHGSGKLVAKAAAARAPTEVVAEALLKPKEKGLPKWPKQMLKYKTITTKKNNTLKKTIIVKDLVPPSRQPAETPACNGWT